MLQVVDNQIRMTQGDSVSFNIIAIFTEKANLDEEGHYEYTEELYQLKEEDILHFILLDMNNEGFRNSFFTFSGVYLAYNSYKNKSLNNVNGFVPPVLVKDFKDTTIKLEPKDTNFLVKGNYMWGVVLEKVKKEDSENKEEINRINEDTKENEIITVASGNLYLEQRFM